MKLVHITPKQMTAFPHLTRTAACWCEPQLYVRCQACLKAGSGDCQKCKDGWVLTMDPEDRKDVTDLLVVHNDR